MRAFLLIAAAASLTSCARPMTVPGSDFARETMGRVAGHPQTCLPAERQQNLRVLDAQTLAYGWGRTIYVNRLPAPCPGLEPLSTVIIDVYGGEYCAGDHVRTLQAGAIIPGPSCNIGPWVPYTKP